MDTLFLRVAGLDVHLKQISCAVRCRQESGKLLAEVRSFGTVTRAIRAFAARSESSAPPPIGSVNLCSPLCWACAVTLPGVSPESYRARDFTWKRPERRDRLELEPMPFVEVSRGRHGILLYALRPTGRASPYRRPARTTKM